MEFTVGLKHPGGNVSVGGVPLTVVYRHQWELDDFSFTPEEYSLKASLSFKGLEIGSVTFEGQDGIDIMNDIGAGVPVLEALGVLDWSGGTLKFDTNVRVPLVVGGSWNIIDQTIGARAGLGFSSANVYVQVKGSYASDPSSTSTARDRIVRSDGSEAIVDTDVNSGTTVVTELVKATPFALVATEVASTTVIDPAGRTMVYDADGNLVFQTSGASQNGMSREDAIIAATRAEADFVRRHVTSAQAAADRAERAAASGGSSGGSGSDAVSAGGSGSGGGSSSSTSGGTTGSTSSPGQVVVTNPANAPTGHSPDPSIPTSGGVAYVPDQTGGNDLYHSKSHYENMGNGTAPVTGLPIVIDLDGDGVEISPLGGSAALFDFDGDGFRERTAWVGADDGGHNSAFATLARTLVVLSVLALPATADTEAATAMTSPWERFEASVSRPDEAVSWTTPIVFQALGDLPPKTAFQLAARISEYARLAGVEFSVAGTPSEWFSNTTRALDSSNFVILLPTISSGDAVSYGESGLTWTIDAWGGENDFLNAVSGGLLNEGAPGCLGRMLGSPDDRVVGYIAAYIDGSSSVEFTECLNLIIPSAFGLNPNVTEYSFPENETYPDHFSDQSEVYFELGIQGACRNMDGVVGLACVRETSRAVWATHGHR